jgi:prevent-host-death family protein
VLQVTTTEFKKNLSKYLTLVNKDEIIITRNGVPIAQISPPKEKSLINQLIGIIPDDGYTIDDTRKERLLNNENSNR